MSGDAEAQGACPECHHILGHADCYCQDGTCPCGATFVEFRDILAERDSLRDAAQALLDEVFPEEFEWRETPAHHEVVAPLRRVLARKGGP